MVIAVIHCRSYDVYSIVGTIVNCEHHLVIRDSSQYVFCICWVLPVLNTSLDPYLLSRLLMFASHLCYFFLSCCNAAE